VIGRSLEGTQSGFERTSGVWGKQTKGKTPEREETGTETKKARGAGAEYKSLKQNRKSFRIHGYQGGGRNRETHGRRLEGGR